jgi:hypothetical protein
MLAHVGQVDIRLERELAGVLQRSSSLQFWKQTLLP